jgi:tRNA(Ile)-lysidine synthase
MRLTPFRLNESRIIAQIINDSATKNSDNSLYAIIYFTMLDKIDSILLQECKLDAKYLLLVGISGGPDSLCLLHVLHKLGYPIIAAHVNHALRPEADSEEQTVKQFASQLGVDFISCQVDVQAYAREYSISIEEAARTMRYRYLFDQAEDLGASAVLVAHNADDQVETILMHLLRGSGLTGLRGMDYRTLPNPWSETIPLIRPFLTTWREDIFKYLNQNALNPVSDQSNLDTTYFRNRLRHELLPTLESYTHHFRQRLLRAGQIMRDDYSVLQHLVSDAWDANLVKCGPGYLAFQLSGFMELPTSIQRYLLRKAIDYHLPGLRDVDFDCIDRGLKFLSDVKPYGQVDLVAGLCMIREGGLFWLTFRGNDLPSADTPTIKPGVQFTLNIPSILYLENSWQLEGAEVLNPSQGYQDSIANMDPFQTWLDVSEIELPLIVRCRKPGERIRPLGMNGHSMKVSDLMINLKLPKRARSSWPIVCSGENILWIPGCRQSELGQVKLNSRLIVRLTLNRVETT